jgi:hypothetical protein
MNIFVASLRSTSKYTHSFLSSFPVKVVKKIIQFRIFEIISAHLLPNKRNESVGVNLYIHIRTIRRMILIFKKIFGLRFAEYSEWTCLYSENTRIESVHILRTCRTNSYVHILVIRGMQEKSNILQIQKQIENIFRLVSEAQMGPFGQLTFKFQKIFCKPTFKYQNILQYHEHCSVQTKEALYTRMETAICICPSSGGGRFEYFS